MVHFYIPDFIIIQKLFSLCTIPYLFYDEDFVGRENFNFYRASVSKDALKYVWLPWTKSHYIWKLQVFFFHF